MGKVNAASNNETETVVFDDPPSAIHFIDLLGEGKWSPLYGILP